MDEDSEWLRPGLGLIFGSTYGKDKLKRLLRLFELDEKVTDFMQLSFWHVPRSYIDKEFHEYKSIFDDIEQLHKKHGGVHEIRVGSIVEGASSCRSLKDTQWVCEIDKLWVSVKLADEKCAKLGRHSGQPGWYWLETSISDSVIAQKKLFNKGSLTLRQSSDYEKKWVSFEVGPSVVNEFTVGSNMIASEDNVLAVQLDFWPSDAWEWVHRSRKWPQVPLVVDIAQTSCFLVHKPFTLDNPYANEWYISFTLAEKMIARKRSKGMKMTYFVFKAIYYSSLKYTSEEKEFGSYLAKTTMMWACEEYPIHQWTPDNLDANIRILMEKLLGYIDKRFLPHYFIPELNLLSRLPESLFTMMEEHLDRGRLLNDPMSFVPGDLLDRTIVRQFTAIKGLGMRSRIMMEIVNVMGWKTYLDTNPNTDYILKMTETCFRDLCGIIKSSIPLPKIVLGDPDELIELVKSELNDDVLRQKIKHELEHTHNIYRYISFNKRDA